MPESIKVPERTLSNSRIKNLFSSQSLSRRKSKGDKLPLKPNEDGALSPSPSPRILPPNVLAELEAMEVELPASAGLGGARLDEQDEGVLLERLEAFTLNQERLQWLNRSSLNDPDSNAPNAVHTEIETLSSSLVEVCQRWCALITSRQTSIQPIHQKLFLKVRQFEDAEMDFARLLLGRMKEHYRMIQTDASDEEIEDSFKDRQARRSLVTLITNQRIPRFESAIKALEYRYNSLKRLEKQLDQLSRLSQEIQAVFDNSPINEQFSGAIPDICQISAQGDAILDFGVANRSCPRLRFRVSSQVLANVSPLFALVFNPGSIPTPSEFLGELPSVPPTKTPDQTASIFYMPQREENKLGALTTLLYAAHMRIDQVPRSVTFRQFVEITSVCHKYRCITPVAMFVEHLWLPQWNAFFAQKGYEDFLFISYVFGIGRMFEMASKSVILKLRGEGDVLEDRMLPKHVRDRIRAVRAAKLSQIIDHCKEALFQYLPWTSLAQKPKDRASGEFTAAMEQSSLMELRSKTRCPQGSYHCDASNLGFLLLTFNELGILSGVLDPNFNYTRPTYNYVRAVWSFCSLKNLSTRLCAVPSAVEVHGGNCDFAPAFRNSMCDIYNSIKGLNVADVNDYYSDRRNLRFSAIGGTPGAESQPVPPAAPGAPVDYVQLRRLSRVWGVSTHLGGSAPLSNADLPAAQTPPTGPPTAEGSSDNGSVLSTIADGDTAPTEYSDQSRSSAVLNASNLASLDEDTRSRVSTEIDIISGRSSPSPSIVTFGTAMPGIPMSNQVSVTDLRRGIYVQNDAASSETVNTPTLPPTREDEKIYFDQKERKEMLTRADKELIMSKKHIMRIGDERGLPPRREGQAADLDGERSPTARSEFDALELNQI
ncbi:MAG: hypothetical protein M1829_000205 [Trizodia sp. TS-e1964]|nr:MAG: hypothetical protein M1829_000205 [Trizodia sp. TS-e1964]